MLAHRAGSSLEFRDHRGYEPGDDLRHIDWNAYARSDQVIVKLYREEVSPHLDILIDGTRSMQLQGSQKARATVAMAGLFAALSSRSGLSHSGWLLNTEANLLGNRDSAAWSRIAFEGVADPAEALSNASRRMKPRGVRVLLSDLFLIEEPFRTIRQLADRASGLIVLQLLAAADAEPPTSGFVQLLDSETGKTREVRIDPDRVRRYRANLVRLQEHWQAACRSVGAVFATVIAEEFVKSWQLDALVSFGVLEVA